MNILQKLLRNTPESSSTKSIEELRLIALQGNNVFCPCCQSSFITFLPAGLKKRANAQCPFCYSLERHRLHWHYFQHRTNLMNLSHRIKLLHIAPEYIFFNKFSTDENIDYVPGAKFGEGYKDEYFPGTQNIDLTSINFEDNLFDVIYCSHVLEHIPEDIVAMKEIYRVLKPGGWALLQVPIDVSKENTYEDSSIKKPEEREKAFGQYDHVRIYGRDYKDRLTSAGFNVKVDSYAREFSDDEIFKFGFMKEEDIYFCTKR